ncbi:MAG: C25 family cysteine peptidase [Candidatus Hermodarchaeota archaeon]
MLKRILNILIVLLFLFPLIFLCALVSGTEVGTWSTSDKIPSVASLSPSSVSNSLPDYKLLIIAPEEFIDALIPLKQFKDATDRPTILRSLEYIYSNPAWDGADEAEEVKKCIFSDWSDYGIEYVMLVGDSNNLPVRYLWYKTENITHIIWYGFHPSDYYYADLVDGTGSFCDWDANGNGLYGECNATSTTGNITGTYQNVDQMNFYLDVVVGRIPATTIEEVEIYVNKVIRYETLTMPSYSWFKKILLLTGKGVDYGRYEPDSDINQLDALGTILAPQGFTSIKLYDEPGYENATWPNINTQLNSGVGFVASISHGSPKQWTGAYDVDYNMGPLTNNLKLPIIWSMGCSTGRYSLRAPAESYADINGVFHQNPDHTCPIPKENYVEPARPHVLQNQDLDSMAEGWTVSTNTGGIAFTGTAGGGTATQGYLQIQYFFETVAEALNETHGEVDPILGDIWLKTARKWYDNRNPESDRDDYNRWVNRNLFGDPSLWVGGPPHQQWAVGETDRLHWDGTEWNQYGTLEIPLQSVSMISPTNGWAVGKDSYICHWNGHEWVDQSGSTPNIDYYSVKMVGYREGWAVGEQGTIIRWDGESWSNFPSPVSSTLYSVDIATPMEGWAVGQNSLLHWNGTIWEDWGLPVGFSGSLNSVFMANKDDGWIVGDGGAIFRWDGSVWNSVTSPTNENLKSVCMFWLGSRGWAVGEGGTILKWQGGTWSTENSGTSADLFTVCVGDTSQGVTTWAFGDGGVIRSSLLDQSWSEFSSPASNDIFCATWGFRNYPPVAELDDLPFYGGTPTAPIEFNAYGYDPEGDDLEYFWDFGDGTTATGANPSHEYDIGSYNVTLCVTDGKSWDAISKPVVIIMQIDAPGFSWDVVFLTLAVTLSIMVYVHRKRLEKSSL